MIIPIVITLITLTLLVVVPKPTQTKAKQVPKKSNRRLEEKLSLFKDENIRYKAYVVDHVYQFSLKLLALINGTAAILIMVLEVI